MHEIIKKAKVVAVSASKEAGAIVKQKFDQMFKSVEKGTDGDVVTEVDYLAENIIIRHISQAFPYHRIQSEEAGDNRESSDWLWQVDPLDGTNNYVTGLPVFSVSIALIYKNKPVLSVIYEPMIDRLFISSLNEGAFCNGVRMATKGTKRRFTIGWIQGRAVQNNQEAVRLRHYIDMKCKRMLRLYAPTIVWSLLAKGDIDAVVLYNSVGEDLYSGILMVKEEGGVVIDFEGNEVKEIDHRPYFIACHRDNKEYMLKLVKEGLNQQESVDEQYLKPI